MSNLAMMMGLSSGAGGVDVADVFSTDLYTSDGNNRDVVNGVDLAGEGGLVWFKVRNLSGDHALYDTERGVLKTLSSNSSGSESTQSNSLTAFNSDGYSIGTSGYVNYSSGYDYVSWAFKKQTSFFDIVTYSGTGNAGLTINHALGSVPGMIIVKSTDDTRDWAVYHRGVDATNPEDYALVLQQTVAREDNVTWFNDTAPTATQFTVGNKLDINRSGKNYVAYLFAHNEDLIQCGSYTGDDLDDGPEIDLGWKPQWLLVKNASSSRNWVLVDNKRGISDVNAGDKLLFPNTTAAEDPANGITLTSTGFKCDTGGDNFNGSGHTMIYVAIKAED